MLFSWSTSDGSHPSVCFLPKQVGFLFSLAKDDRPVQWMFAFFAMKRVGYNTPCSGCYFYSSRWAVPQLFVASGYMVVRPPLPLSLQLCKVEYHSCLWLLNIFPPRPPSPNRVRLKHSACEGNNNESKGVHVEWKSSQLELCLADY